MVHSLELTIFLSKCTFRSDFVLFLGFFPEMKFFWMHAFTACLYETFTLSESFISLTISANAIVMVNFLVALEKAQPNTLAKWSCNPLQVWECHFARELTFVGKRTCTCGRKHQHVFTDNGFVGGKR